MNKFDKNLLCRIFFKKCYFYARQAFYVLFFFRKGEGEIEYKTTLIKIISSCHILQFFLTNLEKIKNKFRSC